MQAGTYEGSHIRHRTYRVIDVNQRPRQALRCLLPAASRRRMPPNPHSIDKSGSSPRVHLGRLPACLPPARKFFWLARALLALRGPCRIPDLRLVASIRRTSLACMYVYHAYMYVCDTCTVGRGVGRYGLGDSGLSMGTGSRPSLPPVCVRESVYVCIDVYASICVCIDSGLSMGTGSRPSLPPVRERVCVYVCIDVYASICVCIDSGLSMGTGSRPSLPPVRERVCVYVCIDVYASICVCKDSGLSMGTGLRPSITILYKKVYVCIYVCIHAYIYIHV